MANKNIQTTAQQGLRGIIDSMDQHLSISQQSRLLGISRSHQYYRRLQKRGIKSWILTGGNVETASAVAEELGVDGWSSEGLPHQKKETIEELQTQGVNDAPALPHAPIGIAVGSGTDVAAVSANTILVNSISEDIVTLILFGTATYKKMIQNLVRVTEYNVLASPLAVGVLYSTDIVLSPEIGAVLMTVSKAVFVKNAGLLRIQKALG